jgi:hypothetical protein
MVITIIAVKQLPIADLPFDACCLKKMFPDGAEWLQPKHVGERKIIVQYLVISKPI